MMSSAPTLNCTCTECITFLRPMVPSQFYTSSFLAPPRARKPPPVPSWIDKLSLSAYDVQTITPVQPAPPLSLVTSTLNASAPGFVRSAFPKTPGMLRCTYKNCRTRLPISWSLAAANTEPLCEEHSEELVDDAENTTNPSGRSRRPSPMTRTTSQSSTSSEQLPGLGPDVSKSSLASRLALSRASSSVSRGSFASWDEPARSKSSVGFEWGAGAFQSRLCW
jgi:hypothetical protein